jgi:hypothetical protein
MKRSSPADLPSELFRATPARRLALLQAAWPAAVGPELARRSEVVALEGSRARIRVVDATWRRSLWRMRRDLLARLRRVAGVAAPHALSFVEGPVSVPPEPSRPHTAVLEPGPLSPALAHATDRIPDHAVREGFRETAARYLARFPPHTTSDDGA